MRFHRACLLKSRTFAGLSIKMSVVTQVCSSFSFSVSRLHDRERSHSWDELISTAYLLCGDSQVPFLDRMGNIQQRADHSCGRETAVLVDQTSNGLIPEKDLFSVANPVRFSPYIVFSRKVFVQIQTPPLIYTPDLHPMLRNM